MTTKHTPGPWQMSGVRSRQEIHGHMVGPDSFGVACVAYSDRTTADHLASLADARLIAAAPELLEALREALPEIRRLNAAAGVTVFNPAATSMIRAAIAKAEGRS